MSVSDQMQMNRAPLGSDPAQMAARQSGMTPFEYAMSSGQINPAELAARQSGMTPQQFAQQNMQTQPQMSQANTPQQFNTFGGATTRNPIVDGN